jgi:hypothetical protein
MRRASRFAVGAVIVVALAGATQCQALGKPNVQASATFKASNHYSVSVSSYEAGKVTVAVNGRSSDATYETRGKTSKRAMKASLPGFGKVNLKFHPRGKSKSIKPPKGCDVPPTKLQNGLWTGKFKFKGEGGYVKVSTNRGKGSVSLVPAEPCQGGGGGGGGAHQKSCVDVSAFRTKGGSQLSVDAQKIKGRGPSFFASYSATKRGVEVSKSAYTLKGSLEADPGAGTASIAPRSPFSGTGKVAHGKLSGSLKVKLPGEVARLSGDASVVKTKCTV